MRRLWAAMTLSILLVAVVLAAPGVGAQGSDCSPRPCAAPASGGVAPDPVVVQGSPTASVARSETSVLDREAGAVASPAVVLVGLAVMATALGLAVGTRRKALEDALSALPRLEPVRDR